jgi:hypothetical protein
MILAGMKSSMGPRGRGDSVAELGGVESVVESSALSVT